MNNIKYKYIEYMKSKWYKYVYERIDKPNVYYTKHKHNNKVEIYIYSWSVKFYFEDKVIKLKKWSLFEVPINKLHKAKVWNKWCIYIVWQMIYE